MHLRFWAAGAVAILLPGPLLATTLDPATTAELVRRAERVSCAKCESCEARRDPRSGLVFTHVRLTVLEDLKGRSPSSTLALRIVGGRDGSIATIVPGMPRFDPGKEVVVLLGKRNRAGYPVVVQASRGVHRLRRDEDGRRYLRGVVTGFEELRGKRRVSLDDFRAAVRRAGREEGK